MRRRRHKLRVTFWSSSDGSVVPRSPEPQPWPDLVGDLTLGVRVASYNRPMDPKARLWTAAKPPMRQPAVLLPPVSVLLQPGFEVHCPHCRQWHVVAQPYASRSTAEQGHLYVTCGPELYFVGQVGHEGRWPVREKGRA